MTQHEVTHARLLASMMLDHPDHIEEAVRQTSLKLAGLPPNKSENHRKTALTGILSEICTKMHLKANAACGTGDVIDGILKVMAPEALKKVPTRLRQELVKVTTGDRKLLENPAGGIFDEPLGTAYPGSVQSEANRIEVDEVPEEDFKEEADAIVKAEAKGDSNGQSKTVRDDKSKHREDK
ncbi:MAG: hypothetical protein ABL949_17060 [Fimbriimonadaceae bacterium]